MKYANVEDQFQKYSKLKKCEVAKFIEWTKKQPHLPVISELEACRFLHATYYGLEIAKQTYDLFVTTRTHCPEFFGNRDILGKDVIDVMNTIAIYPLPEKTADDYQIFIAKLINNDPSKFDFNHSNKLYGMRCELTLSEDGIPDGIVLVIDMKGCQIGHVARLGPMAMKKFLFYLQETLPIRLKGIHFINALSLIDKILAIMRPFMKKELVNMIHIHTGMETFYEFVPKRIVPAEYGGECDNISYEKYYEYVKSNRDFFLEEEKNGRCNEKLRPGKPKSASDLFGIEGNFKKLDID